MYRVGERLRDAREKAGFTLGQVAEYEGISAQYLHKLERGINQPNVWPLLARLAKRYGVTTDQLLGLALTEEEADILDDSRILTDILDRIEEKTGEELVGKLSAFFDTATEFDINALDAFIVALQEAKKKRQHA